MTQMMMLSKKVAVIYGAGGAIGSAIARAFAREGATVFVTARRRGPVDALAREISAAGGAAEAAVVDALDEQAIERHLAGAVEQTGRIDVSFNAVGIPQVGIQGIPLSELPLESFSLPIATHTRSHFLTARAAARHMMARRSGVILMHTPSPARLGVPLVGGMGPAWAAMEAMTRFLSAELGASGVRAVCLRSTGIPETRTIDVVFGLHAAAAGMERGQFLGMMEKRTHRQRSTTLAELADAAVFAASDRAGAMTGTTLNLTGGLAD
jgi:NAD(P)-dependent dehydrogenase (short-subunit alcohol dehydrogenase family)